MKTFILLCIAVLIVLAGGCISSPDTQTKDQTQVQRRIERSPHPCDELPGKFKSQNLNDIHKITRFQQLMVAYPYYVTHCNGESCSLDQFEKMCFLMRQALKQNIDPNLSYSDLEKLMDGVVAKSRPVNGTDDF